MNVMILVVDNYDSFSFNLVQVIGELIEGKEELKVIRNDELYSVRAIPSLYLLDKEKRVILKDAPENKMM
ncbi:MAG: hypothetical protein IIW54_09160, partial [Lachnospiraceae bacterium]|nr:hypothetical protein [Lachnospiraceae bacterium]